MSPKQIIILHQHLLLVPDVLTPFLGILEKIKGALKRYDVY